VHRDVLELQRPTRGCIRLENGQLLNDDRSERGNKRRRASDKRRIDPERRLILMIECLIAIVMIGVVIDVTRMMRLEMAMNDLGVLAALGLGDVHVLWRQQRQAEQPEHGGDGDGAPERHCVDYQWRRTRPSMLSGF
jgi:hypothetical protein